MTQASRESNEAPPGTARLSVVVPAYDEQAVLRAFHRRLRAVLDELDVEPEVVYVNDGSRDGTLAVLEALRADDEAVAIVNLSRNFGKEIALTAGLDHATGDAVVIIDADLQDPPELIPDLVGHWRAGHDNVYARRLARDGETWLKRGTAHLFYRLMRHVGRHPLPPDAGDFRLLSRRALDALLELRETHRFMKGLYAWVGYPSIGVSYRRDPRHDGETKWSYWGLWNLAIEGFTTFTVVPLKVASYLGLLVALLAFVYATVIVYKTLAYGDPVAGYPSLMVTVLFLGGVQLIAIGVIGEYLGRVFNETKDRPLYLLESYRGPSRDAAPGAPRGTGTGSRSHARRTP